MGEFLFKSDRSVEITHAIETVVGAMAKDKQKSTRGAKVGLHTCSFVSSIAAQSSALKTGTLGWATSLHIEHMYIHINTAEPCYSALTNKQHDTHNVTIGQGNSPRECQLSIKNTFMTNWPIRYMLVVIPRCFPTVKDNC